MNNSPTLGGINRDLLRIETEQSRMRDKQAVHDHRLASLPEIQKDFADFKKEVQTLIYTCEVLRNQIADLRTTHNQLVQEIRKELSCK